MIVDLMRNDIGRVSSIGGISVPRMFHVERYASVFQMTSDVEGCLRDGTTASDILRAAFPPGSVTGAPKIRAMEIINELEHDARGVYCGCIGMFRPGGDCLLNVAIRTIVQRDGKCEMGIGSGIVADSDPRAELGETLLKGSFIKWEPPEFQLVETMLYEQGRGYASLPEHIERLRRSAEYFGWPFTEVAVREALNREVADVEFLSGKLTNGQARVRLLLSRDGALDIRWSDAGSSPAGPVRLLLAARQTDPDNVFLYHKTTRRQSYDDDLNAARKAGYFDVLYTNKRGELTECAVTNLVMEIDGKSFTPPLECGLLPGIWRGSLLAEGKAEERVLTLRELRHATCLAIGNSVRGAVDVGRVDNDQGVVIWP